MYGRTGTWVYATRVPFFVKKGGLQMILIEDLLYRLRHESETIEKEMLLDTFNRIFLSQRVEPFFAQQQLIVLNEAYEDSPRKDFRSILVTAKKLAAQREYGIGLNHLLGTILSLASSKKQQNPPHHR